MEIFGTDEFESWYLELDEAGQEAVDAVVEKLGVAGIRLSFPHSSAINGSKLALRELRPKSGRSPLRVFYAFAPSRDAILLLGGDKSSDDRWYDKMIPKADSLYERHLQEIGER